MSINKHPTAHNNKQTPNATNKADIYKHQQNGWKLDEEYKVEEEKGPRGKKSKQRRKKR